MTKTELFTYKKREVMNKKMRKINCTKCGKELFETDKPDGAAGAIAHNMGFIFKMPFLYGVSGCYFFCCKEHQVEWFDENVPKNNEVTNMIEEMKTKL